jgi:hypothetical protein
MGVSIRRFFEQCDNDKIVLPDFQRDFVWKTDQIKRLLSSFMLKLPIGSFLLLEGKSDDFKSRKICFPKRDVNPREECLYLLDGQQRLSALKAVFDDLYRSDEGWKKQFEDTYSQLRYRWFIRVIPDENEDDIFGWRKLFFSGWSDWEPPQIYDLLEPKAIYKTKNLDKWYHPAYNPEKKEQSVSPNYLELNIARKACNEGLVPLYTLFDPNSSSGKLLHERVLRQIAQNRIDELKALCQDGKEDICEILEKVEPEIQDLINNNESQNVEIAWLKLGTQWTADLKNYLESLLEQEQHVIKLEAREVGRAISVFENINRGGTALDVYDLIVAKAAHNTSLPSLTQRIIDFISQDIDLPDSITHQLKGNDIPSKWTPLNMGCVEDNQPTRIVKNQFLNFLSMITYCADNPENLKTEHIKKGKILNLKPSEINSNTQATIVALARAFAFLQFRCGIVYLQDTPYELMILPIAYYLLKDEIWTDKKAVDRLEYWYWTSIFGGAYRQAQNDRTIHDVKYLAAWVIDGKEYLESVYSSLLDYQGYSAKTVLMMQDPDNSIPRALYDAILQYILSQQPYDFLPGVDVRLNPWDIAAKREIVFNEQKYNLNIQDHHIIPLFSATTIGKSSDELRRDKDNVLNSVLNRTYISAKVNSLISVRTPNDYMSHMNTLSLYGHCIPVPFKDYYIRKENEDEADYYQKVFKTRYNELLKTLKMELDSLK